VNSIQVKRVYEPPAEEDGARLLVDRLWPRGVDKQRLQLAGWLKEVAPSDSLRQWFAHDLARWQEFQRRYGAELEANPKAWQPILQAAQSGTVTLLFAAKDTEHNNAVALQAFLEPKLAHQHHAPAKRPVKTAGASP
jgi:uncharacterized protein YeaO (DUF488 family)